MKSVTPRIAAPILLGCILVLCAGCTPSRPALDVWAAQDMVRITGDMPALTVSPIADVEFETVSLAGAANDAVGFQLVVDAGNGPVENLRLETLSLVDSQGRNVPHVSMQIYRVARLDLGKAPAWTLRLGRAPEQPVSVYEILLPQAEGSVNVPASDRAVFWVEVALGHAAPPGNYSAEMALVSDSHARRDIQLRLEVLDLVLPDALPFLVAGGFDHREVYGQFVRRNGVPYRPRRLDRRSPDVRRGLGYLRRLMVLGHEHKIDLLDKALKPLYKRDLDGTIRVDWADYDNIALPYLDGSAFPDKLPAQMWILPISADWPEPTGRAGRDDPTYIQTLAQLTAASLGHLGQRGPGVHLATWPWRKPPSAEAYPIQFRMASLVRRADASAAILSTLPVPVPRKVDWKIPQGFVENTDLLAPPGRWFAPSYDFLQLRPETGNPLAGKWLQPAMPLYGPSLNLWSASTDPRSLCWFAMKYRVAGIFLPDVLQWTGPTPEEESTNESGRLFYPSEGNVAICATLKRFGRGLSDAGLLWILRQRGNDLLADAMINAMVRHMGLASTGDHYLDPRFDGREKSVESWRLGRELLLREALLAVHPEDEQNRRQAMAVRLRWQDLQERTRKIRVEQIRTFSQPPATAMQGQPGRIRIETYLLVDLRNDLSQPAQVTLSLTENRPEGIGPAQTKLEIQPGQRTVGVLKVTHGLVEFTGTGKAPIEIRMESNLRPPQTLQTEMTLLQARPLPRKLEINGVLDDWPLLPAGSATTFRRLGPADGLAQEPEQATFCWIGLDEENLYLAFQCNEDDFEAMVARSSNFVQYKYLLAVQEDLLEVLLDPGRKAVDAGGLYHLLIKPTGVIVTQRGVNTQPPLGEAQSWPVDIRVATARNDRGWTAELAIPLSAFGENRKDLWGINFIRNRPKGPETSSWNHAPRYYYDPRNLGTLILNRPRETAEVAP